MKYKRPTKERLLEKTTVCKKTGCWNWEGLKDKNGYGRLGIGKKVFRCHRLSYEVFCGPIPPDMFVMHSCDNPSCINPDHLSVGSPDDNVQDMLRKGRYIPGGKPHHGQKNGNSKLTEKQAVEIIKLSREKSCARISRIYNVSKTCIERIVSGQSWKHLDRVAILQS